MTVRQDHASSIPSSDANEPRRLLTLRVFSITYEADGIYSFDLRDPFGGTLPPFTAGAHIDVVLPNGIQRSYSLTNSQDERRRYAIGVARDANSRGGSAFMCETLRVGQLIQVAKPSNTFALFEQAPFSVLIAGG
ncbi:oxidoreductase, partial [Mesorhizobium sp. M7D.F.Ca.US.004.03.1.1]